MFAPESMAHVLLFVITDVAEPRVDLSAQAFNAKNDLPPLLPCLLLLLLAGFRAAWLGGGGKFGCAIEGGLAAGLPPFR